MPNLDKHHNKIGWFRVCGFAYKILLINNWVGGHILLGAFCRFCRSGPQTIFEEKNLTKKFFQINEIITKKIWKKYIKKNEGANFMAARQIVFRLWIKTPYFWSMGWPDHWMCYGIKKIWTPLEGRRKISFETYFQLNFHRALLSLHRKDSV